MAIARLTESVDALIKSRAEFKGFEHKSDAYTTVRNNLLRNPLNNKGISDLDDVGIDYIATIITPNSTDEELKTPAVKSGTANKRKIEAALDTFYTSINVIFASRKASIVLFNKLRAFIANRGNLDSIDEAKRTELNTNLRAELRTLFEKNLNQDPKGLFNLKKEQRIALANLIVTDSKEDKAEVPDISGIGGDQLTEATAALTAFYARVNTLVTAAKKVEEVKETPEQKANAALTASLNAIIANRKRLADVKDDERNNLEVALHAEAKAFLENKADGTPPGIAGLPADQALKVAPRLRVNPEEENKPELRTMFTLKSVGDQHAAFRAAVEALFNRFNRRVAAVKKLVEVKENLEQKATEALTTALNVIIANRKGLADVKDDERNNLEANLRAEAKAFLENKADGTPPGIAGLPADQALSVAPLLRVATEEEAKDELKTIPNVSAVGNQHAAFQAAVTGLFTRFDTRVAAVKKPAEEKKAEHKAPPVPLNPKAVECWTAINTAFNAAVRALEGKALTPERQELAKELREQRRQYLLEVEKIARKPNSKWNDWDDNHTLYEYKRNAEGFSNFITSITNENATPRQKQQALNQLKTGINKSDWFWFGYLGCKLLQIAIIAASIYAGYNLATHIPLPPAAVDMADNFWQGLQALIHNHPVTSAAAIGTTAYYIADRLTHAGQVAFRYYKPKQQPTPIAAAEQKTAPDMLADLAKPATTSWKETAKSVLLPTCIWNSIGSARPVHHTAYAKAQAVVENEAPAEGCLPSIRRLAGG